MLGITLSRPPADVDAVIVGGVTPGSVADRGGLQIGDVIRSIGGDSTVMPTDLARAMAHVRPGATVQVVVTRAGRALTFDLMF